MNHLILLLLASLAPLPAAADSLAGNWVGGFKLSEEWMFVRVEFRAAAAGFEGSLELPLRGRRLPLASAEQAGSRARFRLAPEAGGLVFEGELGDGTLVGEVSQGSFRGPFELLRLSPVNPLLYDAYIGDYRLAPSRYIRITRLNRYGAELAFFDSASGRIGLLYPRSERHFVAGPSYALPVPVEVGVTFLSDASGDITGLRWRQGDVEASAVKVRPGPSSEETGPAAGWQ